MQNLLNTARRLFAESSWQQGGEACVRAISLAALDPWLREQAIQVALRAADSALEKDWRSAETLVHELTQVRAGTAVPASLRSRIAEKKREQAVQDAIAEARRLQASGDLPRAQKVVETNLASFAGDPSLQALQSGISAASARTGRTGTPGAGKSAAVGVSQDSRSSNSIANLGLRREPAFSKRLFGSTPTKPPFNLGSRNCEN